MTDVGSKDDTGFRNVQNIVEEYNKNKQQVTKKFLMGVIDVLKAFIVKHELVVYGGLALNELLPKSKKFYTSTAIPDYDCFSPKAKEHAIELANALHKKGYKFIEVKGAVHDGTYKVFVQFNQVADITSVHQSFYDGIRMLSKKEHADKSIKDKRENRTCLLAPINLLKSSLYQELSSPRSTYRWEKLYKRKQVFVKEYDKYSHVEKVKTTIFSLTPVGREFEHVIDAIKQMIKVNKIPLIGAFAITLTQGSDVIDYSKIMRFFSVFDILTIDPDATVQMFENTIGNMLKAKGFELYIEERSRYQEIIPKRVRVFIRPIGSNDRKGISLATMHVCSSMCKSTIEKKGYVVGTCNAILSLLYAYTILYAVYWKNPEESCGHIFTLAWEFEDWIKSEKLDVKSQFTQTCFGKQPTIDTIKKNGWDNTDPGFLYRPDKTKSGIAVSI